MILRVFHFASNSGLVYTVPPRHPESIVQPFVSSLDVLTQELLPLDDASFILRSSGTLPRKIEAWKMLKPKRMKPESLHEAPSASQEVPIAIVERRHSSFARRLH